MNDLLFYTLLIALLYYFFIYLPNQKKLSPSNQPSNQPSTQPSPTVNTQTTQTEPTSEAEPGPSDTLYGPGAQIKFPSNQSITKEDKELEKTVDNLIKNIQEFKKELE